MRIRLSALAILASLAAHSGAQVWEKVVAPGLTYRMEYEASQPRMIHALRYTVASKAVQAKPELAGSTVFEAEAGGGRETLSQMVKRTGAIGGINADFFPWTGDPLGLMVRDGQVLSLPFPNRSAFAWGSGFGAGVSTARVSLSGTVPSFKVGNFNNEVPIDQVGLFSPHAGLARAKTPNRHAVLKVVSGNWKTGSPVEFEVESIAPESAAMPIPTGRAVLTATGTQLATLAGMRAGQRFRAQIDIDGFDWKKLDQAVAGGPALVSKGLVVAAVGVEGFGKDFFETRHPRTAIGSTADGDIWMVTIDGRQSFSSGAALDELARVMQRLGCMEAINLDGGGSTTLNLFGVTLNRPSEGKEREIANAVLLYGPAAPAVSGTLSLQRPVSVKVGAATRIQVVNDKGRVIPNTQVLWSATGSGWIDQGGWLRGTAEGTVFVSAFVGGQIVADGVKVEKP